MIATLLEDMSSRLFRVVNRDYRKRSHALSARIRSLNAYIVENGHKAESTARENMDRALETAQAALAAALADPPRLHREIIEALEHAEAHLLICTPPEHILYRPTNTHKSLSDARKQHKCHMDQSPLESSTPSAHHPVVLENSSREGSSGMVSVIGGQSSHPAGPSGTIVAIPSPGSGDDDPMSINDTARTEKLIAACSSLPPSITSGGTLSLTVTVAVFNSDIERPDISQTYKIQPTDGCVAALIFMVTDPKHPENQLTTLRDHTRWYVRETGRHWYTKDGLAFRRLVPEQSLRDIPASNDTCTVCVVQSDRPYMVLSTGRRYLGVTAGTAEPDKGVVVKDYLDLDLVESCTYYNRVLHAEHSVTVEKKQKWRDLPRHQVHDYSADWLMVFPSDA